MIPATQHHPFEPLFDEKSSILILGSFPSIKSRETGFYYGHPQNRFWRVIASLFSAPLPHTVDEKRALLSSSHIALWDSIASCTISGSSDSSIKNAIPNDISMILSAAPIRSIFCNGQASFRCYNRYIFPCIDIPATCLPSTSAANASWSFERLIEAWKIIYIQSKHD